MSILTEAGKDAVDNLSSTVEEIEEEVRERIEDAINALDRYDLDLDADAGMSMSKGGDYLMASEVLRALESGNW